MSRMPVIYGGCSTPAGWLVMPISPSRNHQHRNAMLFAVLAVNVNLVLFYDGAQAVARSGGIDPSLPLRASAREAAF